MTGINLPDIASTAQITAYGHTAPARPAGQVTVTPKPWIDPDCHEGALIMLLFDRIKSEVEEDDDLGSWPGGDTVEVLLDWFTTAVGIDVNGTYQRAMAEMSSGWRPFTVFALRDNDSPGGTEIAGVVLGERNCVDSDPGGDRQRVAESVIARDADEAERLAYELFESVHDEVDEDDQHDREPEHACMRDDENRDAPQVVSSGTAHLPSLEQHRPDRSATGSDQP